MKKKLLSTVLSAAMLLSTVPAVGAEQEPIEVLLNGDLVEFADQAPANIDGRVLVPIRAVAEKMGAEVLWDEQTQTAQVKKDDTNVSLTINNSDITVNGEKKTIDVAPQIIGDRTMLPIRAVVEQFGCTVDWDDDTKSVIIIDWDGYANEIAQKAPSFYNYMKDSSATYKNYKSSFAGDINFDFAMKIPSYTDDVTGAVVEAEENNVKVSVNIVNDESAKDGVVNSNSNIKIDAGSLKSIIEQFTGAEDFKFDLSKLDEIKLSLITTSDTIYIKTNLVKKLIDASGNKDLAILKIMFGEDSWMKITIEDLLNQFAGDADMSGVADYVAAIVQMQQNTDANALEALVDFGKSFKYDLVTAEMVDSMVETYATMFSDEYFKYTKTGDKSFTVSMNIDGDVYAKMMAEQYKAMGLEFTDEMMKEMMDMQNMEISMDFVSDENGNITSKAKYNYNMKMNEEETGAYMNMNFGMNLTSNVNVDTEVEAVEVPDDALNLAELLKKVESMSK